MEEEESEESDLGMSSIVCTYVCVSVHVRE